MIKFGTSGHRGIIGKDFSLNHVKAIAKAVADTVKKDALHPKIILGYDPRSGNCPTLSEGSFTKCCVDTLLENGVDVIMTETYTATPIISWAIKDQRLDGGLILTASHNPPEYNGIKFNPKNGAPAPPEITQKIETLANTYFNDNTPPRSENKKTGQLTWQNPIDDFAIALLKTVENTVGFIPKMPSPIAIDCKHGTASPVWKALLSQVALSNIALLNEDPKADFNGIKTNPTDIDGLETLQNKQKEINAQIAFANDPDSDRHIILDETGHPLTPEESATIIIDFLLENQRPFHGIATTLASSRILKTLCQKHALHFEETTVGFKYFASAFEKAQDQGQIFAGIESSGGFSLSNHTLEKCGFLPGILMLAVLEKSKQPLSGLRQNLSQKYGTHLFSEAAFTFNESDKPKIIDTLKKSTKETLQGLFKECIQAIDQRDGLKIVFENKDWVLIRLSGTEAVARVYAESSSTNTNQALIQRIKDFILCKTQEI